MAVIRNPIGPSRGVSREEATVILDPKHPRCCPADDAGVNVIMKIGVISKTNPMQVKGREKKHFQNTHSVHSALH